MIAIFYWILLLLWLVLGIGPTFPRGENPNYWGFGGGVILFILLVLIGLKLFRVPL